MSPRLVVGVYAHAEPDRLVQTVRSLSAAGAGDAAVVVLPDGPDAALAAALRSEPALAGLPQWGTAEPLGPAGLLQPAGCAQRRPGGGARRKRHGARAGLPVPAGAGARPAGAGAGRSLCQPVVERAGRLRRRGPVRYGPDRRAGPPAVRHRGALAGTAAQPGRLLPGRRARRHRGHRRGGRGVRDRAVLGDGLQHPGRPGRFPRRLGGRGLRLPLPADRAPQPRGCPADGPRPPPVPGPLLRPAAEPAAC